MKRIIFTAILSAAFCSTFAQSTSKDSTRTTSDSSKHFSLTLGYGEESGYHHRHRDTTTYNDRAYPKFSFGLTFSRFDLGLATLVDNGSFTLSPQNNFLRYRSWKTSNVGFDVIQMGVRFNPNFKIYLSGGFDWTLIRLQKNIDIVPDVPTLTYVVNAANHYSKNRFSSNYLVLPLAFDFRSSPDKHNTRFHFAAGPEVGFLIDGMQKQISSEHGKTKNFNDFHFTRFEYGGFAKIGYGSFGIFTKYYFNDMFVNSPDQKGLKNFNFGLQFGF